MLSLRKIVYTVSSARNWSVRAVLEANAASGHAFDKHEQSQTRFTAIEGVKGHAKLISIEDSRKVLEEAIEYSIHDPSVQRIQGGRDELAALENVSAAVDTVADSEIPENMKTYSCSRNINLHGCMQTNVPDPYAVKSDHFSVQLDHGTPQNMPGNGKKLYQKYISGGRNDVNIRNQRRSFHVGVQRLSQAEQFSYKDAVFDNDPSPQGIQGDDCVHHKLWMETCLRFGLPNCDEQYQSIQSGRKTLAQVFAEQEEIIRSVAESYRKSTRSHQAITSPDALMDVSTPEGIQGEDSQFRLWVEKCNRFSLHKHFKKRKQKKENLPGLETGSRTMADIINEQDHIIRSNVKNHQQQRHNSTSKQNQEPQEFGNNPPESTPSPNTEDSSSKYSRAKLRKAITEYGSTAIVFHVGTSLMSLGWFYVSASSYSGLDVVELLTKLGIGTSIFQSKWAVGASIIVIDHVFHTDGASTFVVAYALHKLCIPVRIGITLTATPFIVKYLRRVGVLKAPPKAPPKVPPKSN